MVLEVKGLKETKELNGLRSKRAKRESKELNGLRSKRAERDSKELNGLRSKRAKRDSKLIVHLNEVFEKEVSDMVSLKLVLIKFGLQYQCLYLIY